MKKIYKTLIISLMIFMIISIVQGNFDTVKAITKQYNNNVYGIKNTYSEVLAYNKIKIGFEIARENDCEKLELYRSTSKNGKYTLLDSITFSGAHSWQSESYDVFSSSSINLPYTTQTDKKKCEFYRIGWGDEVVKLNNGYLKCYFIDKSPVLEKKYYYKVRYISSSKEKIDGKYQTVKLYSNVVSSKTHLFASSIYGAYYSSKNKLKLRWQNTSGADGYYLYEKKGKSWKKIKSLKKSSKSITLKTNEKKTHYYKLFPYKKVNGKVIKSQGYSYKVSHKLTVKGNYKKGTVYGSKLSSKQLKQVKQIAQGFKDNFITKKMSELEKVATIYGYMMENVKYASSWKKNNANTAWGALVYGEGQCSGYARGVKALCDAIGVKCYNVHASKKSFNSSHQWNVVKVSGKWYILDSQGGIFLLSDSLYKAYFGMSCGTKGVPQCKSDKYTMNISQKSLKLEIGKSQTLEVGGTLQKLTWTSSNKKVVTVSSKGKVTAKNAGTATITAKTKSGDKITCKVTVSKSVVKAMTITLNKTTLNLYIGDSSNLKVTVLPTNATYKNNIYWHSSNEDVATVDKNGNIKAVGEGIAYISASCYVLGVNNNLNIQTDCEVIVTNH